jgi:peptide/nickel transport system substrate-binding protein
MHWLRAPLLLAALVASMALPSSARAQAKDELVIGITQFPGTFHPSIESMLARSLILGMARRPITTYDRNWELICVLCTKLPTIENGLAVPEKTADGKQGVAITYTLHPDAKWGDGTPVTTDDVVFTWEVGRHPQSGVSNVELYRRLISIDVKDRKTFTMHFDKLFFDYNAINDFNLLPAHLEKRHFAQPVDYRNRTTFDSETTNPGLYNGPYRITEMTRGSHVVLEPNAHWWGKKPFFKRIVFRAIENTAALEANLLSGGVDYISGELGLPIDQAVAFEKRHGNRFNVFYKPSLVYEHIDLNLDNPALADVRVRRALLLGLDRDTLTKQLFEGRQPVAHGPVNQLDWIHAADVPTYSHDPAKAAALLDEAGWKPGAGNLRRNAKGEALSFELMTTAGNRTRELVQQVLQSQWRKLGIEIRIRNEPARVLFGETVTKRKYTGMALFAWYSAPESVPRTTLHGDHIPTQANNWAGQNFTGYANKEMDGLIERIEVELDRDKRKALWRRLQHLYAEDLPALPLFFRADAFLMPKWLKGVEPTGHQYPSTLWVENWRAEP